MPAWKILCQNKTLIKTCVKIRIGCVERGDIVRPEEDKFIERLNIKLSLIDNVNYKLIQEVKVLKEKINKLENG